jgi:peptidyl-prolyl cis-trans isomerase A (cyclophilin A)/peptidyl-prolyl cis-trans isomerase B (cyclophilin B)
MMERTMTRLADKNPVVVLETSKGSIRIELFPDKAPVTVANFLTYVREGFYDGLIFHRIVSNALVQAGGFKPGLIYQEPTHPPIVNEANNGLSHERGTIAMARAYPINSAAAQFFINVVDSPELDYRGPEPQDFGFAVFGRVIEGMGVVDKMTWIPTGPVGDLRNVPQEDIIILKARVEE